ncbi:glycosyltransferase family 2 protein [Mucilaginibacter sp. UR6-11]|uniref:glycosyltransferase family 2 protein n=1 Tax=Mucilaginibacter sp. UR6-11 TaxID=1435644 RepID=UPI001E29F655|nr:glycosyltransferase family 2 protein [Mucilaginibacter sp. UR6-11]MCC8424854.1 glycosyltransferase [Mucilaginibacter sp. UR6-11]
MILSVVVPVYNVERYLERCLDSILKQTYPNLEIILVNDGSTDDSEQICLDFEKKDFRIKCFLQSNKGPAAARNFGIKMAKGDYIGFIDADDEVDELMFQNLMDIALKHAADIVVSNINLVSERGVTILNNKIKKNTLLENDYIKKNILRLYYENDLGNLPSMVNKIYLTSFLKKHQLLVNEKRMRAEDYWFNFYAFKAADSVYAIDVANYHYFTQNEGSVMKSFRDNQFDNYLLTRKELIENNATLKFDINYQVFDKEFIDHTNEFILLAIVNGKKHIVFEVLKNEEFLKAFNNIIPDRMHTKIIKELLKFRLYEFAFLLYKLWAKQLGK